jgi:hypothetical protein
MAIWRIRTALRIPNAINPHSEYVVFIVFPLLQWLYACALILRYELLPTLVVFLR